MKKLRLILEIIAAIILLCGGYALKHYYDKSNRFEENFFAGMNRPNAIYLTSNEFKKYLKANNDSLLFKISDSLNIKVRPRNVTEVNSYYYRYGGDTINVEIPLREVNEVYPFIYKTECRRLEGIINIKDSLLTLTRDEVIDSLIDVKGGKRAKIMKWLFGGIRLGPKEPFDIILSKCGSQVTKKEINIIK